MQITQRNYNRIMKEPDASKRKAKLQAFCLSFGPHGQVWADAMEELHRLQGIKTALETQYNI